MNEERLALCLKISQLEWIQRLKDGSAWFGKIDNYIVQAIRSGNDDQGDRYEGVFARCKATSPLINKYTLLFGDDLEVLSDGDFVMLRRLSSRAQKAFCLYGIKNSDFEIIDVLNPEASEPMGKVKYNISPRMYDGFLQDGSSTSEVAGFYCSAGHLHEALEKALNQKGYNWKRAMIKYDIDLEQEFLIEPLPGYPELWHKRKDLAYQHESRIIIYDNDVNINGIAVPYTPLTSHSGDFALGQLYIEGTAHLWKDATGGEIL